MKAALEDRSFRQFEPPVNSSPSKGVVIDFFGGVMVWAQHAEGGYAFNEWEVSAADYRVEKHGDVPDVTIHPIDPRASQGLPTKCNDCIEPLGLSISIRNVLDSEGISFRLNYPDDVSPLPLPVIAT